jgi:methionyl aminopeptidase
MSAFQTFDPKQIESIREGGRILRDCLQETARQIQIGMDTLTLDAFAENFIRARGGIPAFKGYRGFPGTLCISINEQCVHGIPSTRQIKDGDIVSLDGGVIVGGLYTDACITVPVGNVPKKVLTFLDASAAALEAACAIVAPGIRVGDISSTIQQAVEGAGYSCVNELTGHGLGTRLHQFPDVPNTGKAGTGPTLPPWTFIAIEPITSMGKPKIREEKDGWTISTADGSLSSHFEHCVLVTDTGHEILA